MTDIVDKVTRSRMMAGIKGKNTNPELMIRKALFARGYRYRLHYKHLPGKPDIVFPGRKAVIFVHGCFWHGHDCHLFKKPSSNIEFWESKISRNRMVDNRSADVIESRGWKILTVWECAIKGKERIALEEIIDLIANWLDSPSASSEIRGKSAI